MQNRTYPTLTASTTVQHSGTFDFTILFKGSLTFKGALDLTFSKLCCSNVLRVSLLISNNHEKIKFLNWPLRCLVQPATGAK